ncbi:MAG: GMC oxidoreductase [Planctomycetaceae bacterium]
MDASDEPSAEGAFSGAKSGGAAVAFDAVVVGAGASGGLAAELLTAAGLRVLLLDAGYPRASSRSPPGCNVAQALAALASSSRLPFMPEPLLAAMRKPLPLLGAFRQPIQSRCHAWSRKPAAYVDDIDCPFTDAGDSPFYWIRCRGIGGRLAVPGHGGVYVRFGAEDFAFGDDRRPSWPFPLEELDPWYSAVETRLGMPAAVANDSDSATGTKTDELRHAVMVRLLDRWPKMNVESCDRIPPPDCVVTATRTGRLVLREGAIARSIAVENGCARGVTWFDMATRRECSAGARLVFLCASPLESTRILLLSHDKANGVPLGARSNSLGHFLMDHVVMRADAFGPWPTGVSGKWGAEPQGVLLQRFGTCEDRSRQQHSDFGVQIYAAKTFLGRMGLSLSAFHEMLPQQGNRVALDPHRRDRWGIPVLRIDCKHGLSETKGLVSMKRALEELAETLNAKIRRFHDCHEAAGLALHECGTARMGNDPTNSVLDPNNECWDARGLFVTDAASFPSQGTVNPTLTVLALTVRACARAAKRIQS